MKNRPILSIIVPTRNRAKYAAPLIRSLTKIPSDQLEIVIHDNSDNTELEDAVKAGIRDPRLIYAHVWERMDAIANFDGGVDLSHGDYVTLLGDDDGVNPEIVEGASWAQAKGLDSLITTRPAQYRWPDKKERLYGLRQAGELTVRPFTGKSRPIDPEYAMKKCARIAGSSILELPKVYYGLARRECLDKVKRKAGTYFPGPSPDQAGAMALANYVERGRLVDYPLFLPGASTAGVAGWVAKGTHQGRLEDYPHLPRNYVWDWSRIVPRFFSDSTIWGEDIVRALRSVGREDILRQFNVPLLHAKCAVFNPAYLKVTLRNLLPALRELEQGYFTGMLKFLYSYGRVWGYRADFLVANVKHIFFRDRLFTQKGVNDIEEATQALERYLLDRRLRFSGNL
jgi:glycosyltransferase involved in cell wall biosynthesis